MLRRRARWSQSDVAIARAKVPRRARPRHARNRAALRPRDILQVFSHRLFVTQIVMLFHQAVEQRLIPAAAHLSELDGLDLVETTLDRRRVDRHRRGSRSPCQRIVRHALHRRQLDLAGAVQHQQHAATHHIAQGAVGLLPLPLVAQHRREHAPALAGMRGDQFPDIDDVLAGDDPAPVLELQHNSSMRLFFVERKGGRTVFRNYFYFSAFTRRHIGAARTRETSPAAISNCASYDSNGLVG